MHPADAAYTRQYLLSKALLFSSAGGIIRATSRIVSTPSTRQFQLERRLQIMHDEEKLALEDLWGKRCNIIRHDLRLRYLQLDLKICSCSKECCSMANFVFTTLDGYVALWAVSPERLDIIGLTSEAEAAQARHFLMKRPDFIHDSHVNARCVITTEVCLPDGALVYHETSAPKMYMNLIELFKCTRLRTRSSYRE